MDETLLNFAKFFYAMTLTNIAIISVGIIGSILSFIVFNRKAFAKNSISIYCRALAIADSFMLFQLAVNIGMVFNVNILILSNILCKLYFYASYGLSAIPGWILVAYSIDKLLCVSHQSAKFQFLKKKSSQIAIVVIIVTFNCALYVEYPILVELVVPVGSNNVTEQCDATYMPYALEFNILYVLEANLIPFAIMIFSTIYTVRSIVRSARMNSNHLFVNERALARRRARDVKFAMNSIILNVLFIFLKTPATLIYVIKIEDFFTRYYWLTSCTIPFFLNYSITFFVHLITNSIFRREFLIMIGFYRRN
jgi:hypothetical protein